MPTAIGTMNGKSMQKINKKINTRHLENIFITHRDSVFPYSILKYKLFCQLDSRSEFNK